MCVWKSASLNHTAWWHFQVIQWKKRQGGAVHNGAVLAQMLQGFHGVKEKMLLQLKQLWRADTVRITTSTAFRDQCRLIDWLSGLNHIRCCFPSPLLRITPVYACAVRTHTYCLHIHTLNLPALMLTQAPHHAHTQTLIIGNVTDVL